MGITRAHLEILDIEQSSQNHSTKLKVLRLHALPSTASLPSADVSSLVPVLDASEKTKMIAQKSACNSAASSAAATVKNRRNKVPLLPMPPLSLPNPSISLTPARIRPAPRTAPRQYPWRPAIFGSPCAQLRGGSSGGQRPAQPLSPTRTPPPPLTTPALPTNTGCQHFPDGRWHCSRHPENQEAIPSSLPSSVSTSLEQGHN
jgi:hypothetical protein